MAPLLRPTEIHARRSSVEQAQHAQITQRQESGKLLGGVRGAVFSDGATAEQGAGRAVADNADLRGGALIVAGGLVMAFWRM